MIDQAKTKSETAAALLLLAAAFAAAGCAGRRSVREQYEARVREINEKHDAELVRENEPFVASRARSCAEFLEGLGNRYRSWRPGEAGARFCSHNPNAQQRRAYELQVRTLNNKAVSQARARRLAQLKKLYLEAARVESGDDEPARPEAPLPPATPRAQTTPAPGLVSPRAAPPQNASVPSQPAATGYGGEQLPYAPDADEPAGVAPQSPEQRRLNGAATHAARQAPSSHAKPTPNAERLEPVTIPRQGEAPPLDQPVSEYE